MSERAGTEAGYEEAGRSKEREARERRTDIALYSQDTERQTQKTRTKTQLASFLRHSTLSLSLSRATPTRHYLYKRGRYHGEPLAPPPTVPRDISCCACVFSLLTYSSLTPYSHAIKKSICAHTPSLHRHRDPPSSSCARGHKQGERRGHTKRGTARPCKGRRSRTEAHTPPAAPACIPPLCARLRRGTLPAQASARRAGRADPRRSAPRAQRTATGTSTCCRAPGGRATTGVYTCRVTARTCRSSP